MTETLLVQGTGGATFAVDPEVPFVAAQLATGALRPVAGTSAADDAIRSVSVAPKAEVPTVAERPPQSAHKSAWVDWAVNSLGLSREDAESWTKQDLIDLATDEDS